MQPRNFEVFVFKLVGSLAFQLLGDKSNDSGITFIAISVFLKQCEPGNIVASVLNLMFL